MNGKEELDSKRFLIGVVGPCGSGKSTLIARLESLGFRCRHIAQEHSYVQSMWKRITNPDILIYLNASFEICTRRRKLDWTAEDYQEQLRRLDHARQHADLIIETDELTAEEVCARAIQFIKSKQ